MGYTTEFKGELKFTSELTARQLAFLKSMCGEDCREHPEWNAPEHTTYMDLELTPDFGGLRWSGAEKTYEMVGLVNTVISHMRKAWPEFGLTGELQAQGDEARDRWTLVIGKDGLAKKVPVVPTGRIVKCPHCDEEFEIEETKRKT